MTEKQAEAIKNFDNKILLDMFLDYYRTTVLQFEIVGERSDIYNALRTEVLRRMDKEGR